MVVKVAGWNCYLLIKTYKVSVQFDKLKFF